MSTEKNSNDSQKMLFNAAAPSPDLENDTVVNKLPPGCVFPPSPPSRDLLVKDVLREIRSDELVNPFFQREFVWTARKQQEFIDYTLKTGQLSAPVHTYCVSGSLTRYLKDGRQRLTTLQRAIENPTAFGLTSTHAELLSNIGVHIMHRQHVDHNEAMIDFQNLNKGTGLLPYDLWRGELVNTEVGKHVYAKVRSCVVHVTAKLAGKDVIKTDNMAAEGGGGRKRNGQLHRGALALFYMWAAEKPTIDNILTHNNYDKAAQPEVLVAKLISSKNWTIADADREIQKFYDYLEAIVALVSRLVAARGGGFTEQNKLWEIQAVRAIFNAGVFIHLRDDVPKTLLADVVNWYLKHAAGFDTWISRFDYESRILPGQKEECRMSQHNLYWLREAAAVFGVDIDRKRSKKKNKTGVRGKKGCDESHTTLPASEGGTETVVEDAITNRSRGAKPMTQRELFLLTRPIAGENNDISNN